MARKAPIRLLYVIFVPSDQTAKEDGATLFLQANINCNDITWIVACIEHFIFLYRISTYSSNNILPISLSVF